MGGRVKNVYFALNQIFSVLGCDDQSIIYAYISIVMILIIIAAILALKEEDNDRKVYWENKEKGYLSRKIGKGSGIVIRKLTE